jgi:hypothetical protein
MNNTSFRLKLTTLLTGLALVSGCSASLQYRPGNAKRVVPAQQEPTPLMMADIVDGRDRKASSDLPLVYKRSPEKSFGELRKSARKHAKRTGLVSNEALFAAAPTTAAELEQVLAQARAAGAKAVLITRLEGLYAEGKYSPVHALLGVSSYLAGVGLLPLIVGYSLPLSGEYASAKIGAFLVDPSTGLVFASYEKSFVHLDKKVTAWGYAPTGELKDALYHAMQQVYEEAAQVMTTADPKGGPQVAIATLLFDGVEETNHD